MQDIPIGGRMRLFRRSRGMTREQLAALAGVSRSWVSAAERGVPLDRRIGPLSRIARALGVSLPDLMGQRLPLSNGSRVRDRGLGTLRRALLPGMAATWTAGTVDLRRLLDGAAETWRLRNASRYSALGGILPGLIAEGEQARRELTGAERAAACSALAAIHAGAAWLCAQVGEVELAVTAVALAARTAEEAGSPAVEGIAARQTALVLLRMGEEAHALDVATAAARELEGVPRSATPDEVAVHGSLLLTSAIAQARLGEAASAWHLLAGAEADSSRLGPDRTDPRMAFGRANVLLHGVGVAVELGDPRAALLRAAGIDLSTLPAGLTERQCRHWVDVARAHAGMRNADDAVDAVRCRTSPSASASGSSAWAAA